MYGIGINRLEIDSPKGTILQIYFYCAVGFCDELFCLHLVLLRVFLIPIVFYVSFVDGIQLIIQKKACL